VTASTTTKTVHVTSTKIVSTFTSEVIQISVEYIASVSTVIIPGKKRGAEKAVPTYASSCTARGQYASACSCYGVFPPYTVTKTAKSVVGRPKPSQPRSPLRFSPRRRPSKRQPQHAFASSHRQKRSPRHPSLFMRSEHQWMGITSLPRTTRLRS
jgi:hypothetical protein